MSRARSTTGSELRSAPPLSALDTGEGQSPFPALLDGYEILSLLGRGGMGAVYRARDRASGKVLAIKVLLESDASTAARFAREAAVLSRLDHPGIVRYAAHGVTSAGEPYLAMEWLDGENLAARLRRGTLTVDEALTLAKRVSEALAAAHAIGIVHRDLKPSNLFLVDRNIGRAKILDFGIAWIDDATMLTNTGAMVGTPGYMAPEQARGAESLTPAADVFALGAVLFRALTGRAAFEGHNALAILAKLVLDDAPRLEAHRPDAPPALAELLARMLARDPTERPADGEALRAELSTLSTLEDRETTAPSSIPRSHALTEAEQCVVTVVMIRPEVSLSPALAPAEEAIPSEVRRTAERARGRIERLADGSIAVAFGGSGIVKDHVALAARSALVIQAHMPGASLALATGRGTPRDTPLLSEAIERAAQRVPRPSEAPAAGPGHVAIDETTAALLDPRFEWRDGPSGPELLNERQTAETARRLLGRPMPCVGREREIVTLESAFDFSVEDCTSQVFLVTAPAGVGKSRLCHEFTRSIQRRSPEAAIWLGRGDSMHAGSSLYLVGQALSSALRIQSRDPVEARRDKLEARLQGRGADARRLAEFLGEIVGAPFPDPGSTELYAARRDPRLMAEQTQRAFRDFIAIEGEARPLVVILDDLHWGDAASVRFLDIALRDTEERSIFLLGLARPEVHARFPKLWAERCVQELRLSPLSKKASRRLVGVALGEDFASEAVDRLVDLAEGNAFYLEELIRAAAEGDRAQALPETVVAMVQAKLLALDPDARRVLRAASVYGEVFWSGAIVALLGDTSKEQATEWVLWLLEQEVLVRRHESRFSGEEELAFRHALLREGAYAMLTEEDKSLGHRLAGQWLEQHGERDDLALAMHFDRGEDQAQAAHHYLRAAEHARGADDVDAILSCVERGLGCSPEGELRAALMGLKADVSLRREQYKDSIALATEALEGLLSGSRRWYTSFYTLSVAITFSQPGALIELTRRFLGVLPSADVHDEFIRAGAGLQGLLAIMGDKNLAYELLSRLSREGAHLSQVDASASAYVKGAVANHHHLIEEAPWTCMQANEDATVNLEQAGRWGARCTLASNLGKALTDLGDHERAESVLRENLALAERRRNAISLAFARVYLARLLTRAAPLEELAEPEALARAVTAPNSPVVLGLAHGVLAQLAVRRGDLAMAEVEARMACERLRPFPTYSWDIAALRVQILLALGRAQEALDAGEEVLTRLSRLGVAGYGELDLRLAVAEAKEAVGHAEQARALLREALQGLRRRVDDIPSAEARARYLTAVPTHARLISLGREWLGEEALRQAGLLLEMG